jgi:hypothetical protein
MKTETWEFFYHNAGWGYNPCTQSEVAGRALGAVALAQAEAWANAQPSMSYFWYDDPEGAECQREDGTYETLPAMVCVLVRSITCNLGEEHCATLASLCGITESDDYRERTNYRRVVEAELALEVQS